MKEIKQICGHTKQAQPLVIDSTMVYIHTNIQPLERNGKIIENLFTYDEIQYTKDEYIQLMAEENEKLNKELIDTQLALCEVYEMFEGGNTQS